MDKYFLERCLEKGMSTRDIEKICELHHRTISYWINKHGLADKSKFKKTETYRFDKIDTKEKAYALGFILADSAIDRNGRVEISVCIRDKEVLEYISGVIGGNITYSNVLDKKTRRFPRARLHKRIVDISKFIGGPLKKDRHYPRVRSDLERYLIQGFFDAEGCITWGRRKDKNRIWHKICFSSQLKILEGLQQYILKHLNISTVVKPKSGEDCYILEFANKEDVLKFCDHIYSDENDIVLKRKYLKYKALRLELEENGESDDSRQYRAEPTEWEGVETNGGIAICLNDRISIQG